MQGDQKYRSICQNRGTILVPTRYICGKEVMRVYMGTLTRTRPANNTLLRV